MEIYSYKDYIFAEDERYVTVISTSFIFVLILLMGAGLMWGPERYFTLLVDGIVCCSIALIYIWINHLRYGKYRFAQFAISNNKIGITFGDEEISVSRDDLFELSVMDLYISGGRSFSYRKYIVIWKEKPPVDGVHPLVLLKKKQYVILPYSSDTISIVKSWAGGFDLPEYPKIFHNISSQMQ